MAGSERFIVEHARGSGVYEEATVGAVIWRITTGRRSQRCSGISAELAVGLTVGFAVVSAFEFAFVLGTVWALARGGCVANESKSSKLVRATGSKPGAM